MLFLQLAVVAAIASLSNAAPTSLKHTLHEKRESPTLNWIKGARIEASAVLPMRIGLAQNNLEKGHDLLMEV
jgi:tripeptidyl-peptidase-1